MDTRIATTCQIQPTAAESTVFIYKMMSPDESDQKLLDRVAETIQSNGNNDYQDGHRAWLIRESRVMGLLTIQSIIYDQINNKWISAQDCNAPCSNSTSEFPPVYIRKNSDGTTTEFDLGYYRYMLSNKNGWVLNQYSPSSDEYQECAAKFGGKKLDITAESGGQYVADLLVKLESQGFKTENRINPRILDQTTVKGYSRYTTPSSCEIDEEPMTLTLPPRNTFCLPDSIACALICPITRGQLRNNATILEIQPPLMKDPVVETTTGITYEREALRIKYTLSKKPFRESVEFYPNIVLKNIIGYLSATEASPTAYLSYLGKIGNTELIDPISFDLMTHSVITPSGFSYEKNVIENYIQTRESSLFDGLRDPKNPNIIITKNTLVENKNLNTVLKQWPEYYDQLSKINIVTNKMN